MAELSVRDLERGDIGAAVSLFAQAMRDNPVNVAAYGPDPERRIHLLEQLFATLFAVFPTRQVIGAYDGSTLLGAATVAAPGTCQPSPLQKVRFVPGLVSMGPHTARQVGAWLAAWAAHDPERAHAHLGPVAVATDRQGHGIGGRLLTEHCRQLDRAGLTGYLETDKRENVGFYERHGYTVTAEAAVIGTTNWFMTRERPSR
ncbi:MAG TPA: GNAT family N-acetyltransferase [Mycobacteriales bacterium]|nr:GNAT family N-acetyltransferase [Mycobacteriales bacterium]